jgi:hypothetical protein
MVLEWKNIRERVQKYDRKLTKENVFIILTPLFYCVKNEVFAAILRMFKRLKEKWQVSWVQFALIFSTFALGGSLCGYIGRTLLSYTSIEKGTIYVIIYVVLVTILWPFCVLLVSIPFAQFPFFKGYLGRIWLKITKKK